MISIVAEVFNVIAIILQQSFLLASFVGRLIVTIITKTLNVVFNGFDYLMLFLQILYEDNVLTFSEEIPNFFCDALETFGNQLCYILSGLFSIFRDIIHKIGTVFKSAKLIIGMVGVVLSEVLSLLKDAIIFLGNALWLIITFIPVHLPQLLQMGLRYIKDVFIDVIVDGYMILLKFTNFMTDVPLESFIGITSAIIIIRLFVHYRREILSQMLQVYWLLIRKLLYMYYTLYNYMTDSEVRVITHMASGQEITTRDSNFTGNEIDDGSGADALCIICQERQKCVLTLPCRHVCLCAECCRRLYGYQRTCPICRTFIYHSVTVYL